jgi:hypothetical protein
MWAESARHQSQPSNKQNQHDQRIEETRWPEIDMHVGNNARKNEERARDRKKPSDQAAPTPEKQAHSDQHWQKRDPESIAPVKSPVGADHADLIAEKVSSDTSHGETDQEVAEPAGRPTHVAQGPIFHTGRISDAGSGVPTSGLMRFRIIRLRKRSETKRDQRSKECVVISISVFTTFEIGF